MARDYKDFEEQVVPDDYTDMLDGNANTDSDGTFGDFVYEQRKVGNKVQNVRRAVVEDQIDPAPYPENTANPQISPEEMQNGTYAHNEEELPSLQQKIDEAEAILAGKSYEDYTKSKSKDRGYDRD